jgi:ribosomal protein S18 acetylase RimI-like enzyme
MALQESSHPLDNPIWQSLTTFHSRFAVGDEYAKRFPKEIGPFVAVPEKDISADSQLEQLVAVNESVYFIGIAPFFNSHWRVEGQASLLQMVCQSRIKNLETGVEVSILSDPDNPAMLELMSQVYPGFFRPRTYELGNYLGIFQNGRLAAMSGERMHLTGYREISAVCTHPDFSGRGYARVLVSLLINAILDRYEIPFLHVASENERAVSLYKRIGFTTRCHIPLWLMKRLK